MKWNKLIEGIKKVKEKHLYLLFATASLCVVLYALKVVETVVMRVL